MELVAVRLGGSDSVIVDDNTARIPFRLPGPAVAVFPLLQSFRFAHDDDDTHVDEVQIRLTPLFNSGESTTQGEVEIETVFHDPGGGIFSLSSHVIGIEIDVLVVGI